jgi:hypothetical protein
MALGYTLPFVFCASARANKPAGGVQRVSWVACWSRARRTGSCSYSCCLAPAQGQTKPDLTVLLTLDDQTSTIYMCAVSVELLQLQGST